MTSDFWTIFWSAVIGIFVWDAIKAIFRRFGGFHTGGVVREAVVPAEIEPNDPKDPAIRASLVTLLTRARVVGDFNWRDGRVELPVPPEKVSPIATILTNAVSHVAAQRNPNSVSIYWRDSVNDRFNILPDIDFEVLREAASIMRRVAEDRRLSTKLYQGLSDSELTALARSIVISRLLARGDDSTAKWYRTGERDDSAAMASIKDTIRRLYEIKGVKPE